MEHIIEDIPIPIPLAKRLFDIFFSLFFLILLSPVFLIIALCSKIEGLMYSKNKGPLVYTETRISQGKPFTLRKFRVFKTSAYEPIRARGEIVQTKPLEKNIDNLTRCGKVLKNFYLDEAPQLLSVLTGDMSLIGPRPWNPPDYENEVRRGEFRKKVIKAGLTGPVQIHKLDAQNHGGEHKLDTDYIVFVRDHSGIRTVLHDMSLVIKSIFFMVKGQGL